MTTDKPIMVIDCESTGTNVNEDAILELSIGNLDDIINGDKELVSVWRFNPGCYIPPEATKIHGISDADVAQCRPFDDYALMIAERLTDVHIAGYNVAFDLQLLINEMGRCGFEWEPTGSLIDVAGIYKKMFPRTLADAVKQYLGVKHDKAHSAKADVIMTGLVLMAQLDQHAELTDMTLPQLARLSEMSDLPRIDIAGKLVRDADGDAVFTFGKAKGRKVKDDTGFANWMLGKDFTANTKRHVRAELERLGYNGDE